MKFIHNRDKTGISILNTEKQLILKITEHPLLFYQQHRGWFLAWGKETIRISLNSHKNNEPSLDVFYNQKHLLSFMCETPEREAYLSVYDKLPPFIKIPNMSDIRHNKWILTDYRDPPDNTSTRQNRRIKKIKRTQSRTLITHIKKARFREL